MCEITQLIRHTVVDVLTSQPEELDESIARAVATKIAGDPRLDRLDKSSSSIEPVANIVAEALYRIDLGEFGIQNSDTVRREIVEEVTTTLVSQTTTPLLDNERNEDDQTNSANHDDYSKSVSDSEDDIIIAEPGYNATMKTAFDDDTKDKEKDRRQKPSPNDGLRW